MKYLYRLFVVAFIFFTANMSVAHSTAAHVHGVANLDLAVDRENLSIVFSSPLDNLLGFEHLPNNPEQKKIVDKVIKILKSPERLFAFSPENKCKVSSIKLSSLVIDSGSQGSVSISSEAPKREKESSHNDLDAEYSFVCKGTRLNRIDVSMFSHFPHLHRINAQIVGAKGQFEKKLSPADSHIDL